MFKNSGSALLKFNDETAKQNFLLLYSDKCYPNSNYNIKYQEDFTDEDLVSVYF